MATSGLDHDIKLWAPTAESPTGLKGLKEVPCSFVNNILFLFLENIGMEWYHFVL